MTAAVASARAVPGQRRLLVTVCVMMTVIMQALDITIANVALPYMQGSLSATLDQVSWVLTSYIVAAAIMTAPVGWLAERYGRKRLLVVSTAGFTVASMLCGIAQGMTEMVLYRVLQGAFGAALVPLSQAVMMDIYPPERRGAAMALWGMGIMIGPIMGPVLGGVLTDALSWRWVFFINLPFGIITALGLLAFMDETRSPSPRPFDWLGFVTLSAAIGFLQLMLDRGGQLGWFDSAEIVAFAIAAGASFYLFMAHALTTPRPFVTISIFRDRNFTISVVLMFLVGVLLLATMALMIPLLQGTMGYPIVDAGLVLGTRGLGTMVMMLIVARLVNIVDPRLLVGIGLTASTVALYSMVGLTVDMPVGHIVFANVLQGLGLGLFFVPLNVIAFATLAPALRTEAAALWTLIRNLGSSVGVSIVIAELTSATTAMHQRFGELVTPFNIGLAMPGAGLLDPATEQGRALLDRLVTEQATLIAYSNDFKLMVAMSLAVFPLLLLLSVRRGQYQ